MASEEYGQRRRLHKPPLSVEQVLVWAEAHFERTGCWPHTRSGAIPEAPGENWNAVNQALWSGRRGFSGGSSLSKLLRSHFGPRCRGGKPPLTLEQILAWMQTHHRRTRKWPHAATGVVQENPRETWNAIDMALRDGSRGLPRGLSLLLLKKQHGWK
jgi:hypothetical protein